MIYKGVVAWLNGAPDSAGDVLSDDVTLPENPVRILHNFYEKTDIGRAHLILEKDRITAYVDLFDQDIFAKENVEQLYVVLGGKILEREGGLIKKWTLQNVSLTSSPCDATLPKLVLSECDNCCEYKGPPFKKCFKCGGRQSF